MELPVPDIHRVHRTGHVERHQLVAIQIQREGIRPGQHHLPEPGRDDAVIHHLRGDEPSQPGIADRDIAVIDDFRACIRRAGVVTGLIGMTAGEILFNGERILRNRIVL